MANRSSEKGTRRERELVGMFDDAGFGVLRAPASGSATVRELPDLVAARGPGFGWTCMLIIEAKATHNGYVRLDPEEIKAILTYAKLSGGLEYVAVRPDRDRWHFYRVEDLNETAGGAYSVKQSMEGKTFEEVVEECNWK